MIVAQFWAEARARHTEKGRQVTVRRFGWSDDSQADAQATAERRAAEALARIRAGEKLLRRDPKVPYNGAQGVPIREQIVSRHGRSVITRNAYGARCLNTPDVLFVDIDFAQRAPWRFTLALVALAVLVTLIALFVLGLKAGWLLLLIGAVVVATAGAHALHGVIQRLQGGAERIAIRRIRAFLASREAWNLRLYRTPAGLRVLATHRAFASDDPEVAACFAALGADALYRRMCSNQRCFRARLTAKPWRIGIDRHLRPRPGVWPVAPERLAQREAWIAAYEAAARGYAACTFIESIGSGRTDPEAARVVALHDAQCSATRNLPIA